jgi:hypothetical protein
LENQGEILHQIKKLTSNFSRIENRLKEMEDKLVDKYDLTNEKNFIEVIININIIIIYNLKLINIKLILYYSIISKQ